MKPHAHGIQTIDALRILIFGLLAFGCSRRTTGALVPNQRPQVNITSSPITHDLSDASPYVTHIFWSGYDPDGRIDHFEFATDPTANDTTWVATHKNEVTLNLRASRPDSIGGPVPRGTDFHIFVLRAVDDQGATSATVNRSFYSYTIAPSVQILSPLPNHLLVLQVGPSILIQWSGADPDGEPVPKPVSYKFKLFSLDDPDNILWLVNPDSLRRRDAPGGFADWDSSGREETSARFTNLTLGKRYLFALVAYDQAGAYSPVFSLDANMLLFQVTTAALSGPVLHIFNSYVDYEYPSGGYSVDPQRELRLEMPTNQILEFEWDATPTSGAFIQSYRWVLDTQNLSDNTPRSDENADVGRWSRPSNATTSCRVGPFGAGQHYLYVEAKDNNGTASLGIVHFAVIQPTFARELLVVNDTRLEVDKFAANGCPIPYTTPWPSAAELDTFLFARGGAPWRCAINPSSGARSVPGLLAGYSFDTLGTRLGLEDPAMAVPLSTLTRYRNVIWMVDPDAAVIPDYSGSGSFNTLWAMSRPGYQSTLSTFTLMGGRVWLFGGGAAYASLIQFDDLKNNRSQITYFSNLDGELASPRLMFDGAHWQSEIAVTKGAGDVRRASAAERVAASPWTHYDAYTGQSLSAPNYLNLPPVLRLKTPDTDPLPPTRAANRASQFYTTGLALEVLSAPNSIEENVGPDEQTLRLVTTLDTLYTVSSGKLPNANAPIMTYYHGREPRQFVFSGFSPWSFAREDAQGLVDFVLQDIWQLHREPRIGATAGGARVGSRPSVVARRTN